MILKRNNFKISLNFKEKEKKNHHIQGIPTHKATSWVFSRNFSGTKEVLWYFLRAEREYLQSKILYPARKSFKTEGEISFSSKQKVTVHHNYTDLIRNVKWSLSEKKVYNKKEENIRRGKSNKRANM